MKRQHLGVFIAVCAGITCVCDAVAANWIVEDSSTVRFSAVQEGTRFNGAFRQFVAEIDFDPASPESGSVVGVVQIASVSTRDSERDSALGEPDWFNVREYPRARFESQSIEKADDGYVAVGRLTLKGQTNPVRMRFTFDISDPSAATFAGRFTINRFDYKVGENWRDTTWISEDVAVEVDLRLRK